MKSAAHGNREIKFQLWQMMALPCPLRCLR